MSWSSGTRLQGVQSDFQMRNVHRGRRAFTLIELLTVIAITAVLLTIIVLPIFQSFNLTRAAQA